MPALFTYVDINWHRFTYCNVSQQLRHIADRYMDMAISFISMCWFPLILHQPTHGCPDQPLTLSNQHWHLQIRRNIMMPHNYHPSISPSITQPLLLPNYHPNIPATASNPSIGVLSNATDNPILHVYVCQPAVVLMSLYVFWLNELVVLCWMMLSYFVL